MLGGNGGRGENDYKGHVYGGYSGNGAQAIATRGWYGGHTSSAFDYVWSGKPPGLQ